MTGDVMGGGVVVAIAAALWLAYLIPVWLRRREYLATERNAVRLQQTLRILAETSEVPEQVRMEATARTVAEQQRILKRAEQKKLAEARAAAAAHARREQAIAEEERRVAEEAEAAAADAIALERAARAAAAQRARVLAAATAIPKLSPQRRRRLRRSRGLSTLVLVAAVVGGVIGTVSLVATGAWLTLAVSSVVGVLAIGMLVRLAGAERTAAVSTVVPLAAPIAPALYDDAQHDVQQVSRPRQESWTPRPLPKPLHLSRGTIAATAMASMDAATALRRSAALAEVERKAAERIPAPMPLRPVATAPAVPAAAAVHTAPAPSAPVAVAPAQEPSRYAAMGLVGDLDSNAIDLDAVLRRRRAAS
ncbi:hypothetical protein ASE16_12380 [Leifsonia sp. Root227]|uniref:hypothetical protein n=1 Tax=unclassified Leifsonia TaxID=2663824 RepID=UPI0006F3A09F|nr:hypothetical protein [Leifsonia sp. Root227]KRC49523.1 hypothetical protein ASE16_12380 [Leifsonia sp. Root227]